MPSCGRLTCAVCLERFRRPKLLPCFHTFCLTCLESLAPPPAPSLTCPACRTVVPLPLGGAADFQSNFYLEEELVGEAARECDVCSESRDVEYRCVECQQYFCAPCRGIHGKITTSRHHTLLPFSSASAAQRDQRDVARKCPKHDLQRQIFFCKVCDVTVCPHCKLTSHEGHATEDLEDTASRARQDLETVLRETQHRMRKLKIVEAEAKEKKGQLAAELNNVDDVIKKRAADVILWAEQARDAELDRAKELCHVTEGLLNQTLEATQNELSRLSSRTDHVTAVLSGQDNMEVIQLLNEIVTRESTRRTQKSNPETHAAQETCPQRGDKETEEGGDLSSFLLVNQRNEENLHSAVLGYIGHVSSTNATLPASLIKSTLGATSVAAAFSVLRGNNTIEGREGTVDEGAVGGQAVNTASDRAAQHAKPSLPPASGKGLSPHSGDARDGSSLHQYDSCFQRQSLPEQEAETVVLVKGSGSRAVVTAMCLTTDNKLWVKCRPQNTHVDVLKLFDAEGNLVRRWNCGAPKGDSLTCIEDTLLSPLDWRWLKPSGESGCLDNAPNDWALCSKSLPPHVVLFDPDAEDYKIHRLHVRSLHPLKVELVPVSEQGAQLDKKPRRFDAASCGTIFCYTYENTIAVFCVDSSSAPTKVTQFGAVNITPDTYEYSISEVYDICFFTSDGKEPLCVVVDRTVWAKNCRIKEGHLWFVVDYEEGFLCMLKEEQKQFECTKVTAHNTQGRLWLGDTGGQIRMRDMKKYTLK